MVLLILLLKEFDLEGEIVRREEDCYEVLYDVMQQSNLTVGNRDVAMVK